jgi:hypothetical protein
MTLTCWLVLVVSCLVPARFFAVLVGFLVVLVGFHMVLVGFHVVLVEFFAVCVGFLVVLVGFLVGLVVFFVVLQGAVSGSSGFASSIVERNKYRSPATGAL